MQSLQWHLKRPDLPNRTPPDYSSDNNKSHWVKIKAWKKNKEEEERKEQGQGE